MKLTSDVKQRKQRSQHNGPNPNNSYKTKKKFTGSYTEVNPEIFSRGSKCNNKEYTVLEGSAGRKIISNKNEARQFQKKTTYLENCNQLAPVSYGKILHVLKTAMAAVSNAPSCKPTQFLPEGLAIRDTQTNKFRR